MATRRRLEVLAPMVPRRVAVHDGHLQSAQVDADDQRAGWRGAEVVVGQVAAVQAREPTRPALGWRRGRASRSATLPSVLPGHAGPAGARDLARRTPPGRRPRITRSPVTAPLAMPALLDRRRARRCSAGRLAWTSPRSARRSGTSREAQGLLQPGAEALALQAAPLGRRSARRARRARRRRRPMRAWTPGRSSARRPRSRSSRRNARKAASGPAARAPARGRAAPWPPGAAPPRPRGA